MKVVECEANEAFLKVVFTNLVRNVLQNQQVSSEYLDVDTFTYSEKGEQKIAVFVAFLQDYEQPNKDLDEAVLQQLVDEVQARDLTNSVDDISVNLWQWTGGKATFSPIWEE